MEAAIQEALEFPSLETWSFQVLLRGDGKSGSLSTDTIRDAVIVYLVASDTVQLEQNWKRARIIRSAIDDLVATRLSTPETIYYLIDYEESEGSFIISFGVLAAVYHGVAHYGEFREGLDRIVEDLRVLFGGVSGVVARVSKRFKARQQLPWKRKDPKIDCEKI